MEDTASRLITLTHEIGRMLRQRARHIGDGKINFLQLHAMAAIAEHEGMAMKEFADCMKIASPSATSFIDRLVKLGFVRRSSTAGNRKLVLVRLTPLGKRFLVSKMKERTAIIRHIIDLIPENDQRHLERILRDLQNALRSKSISAS